MSIATNPRTVGTWWIRRAGSSATPLPKAKPWTSQSVKPNTRTAEAMTSLSASSRMALLDDANFVAFQDNLLLLERNDPFSYERQLGWSRLIRLNRVAVRTDN